MKSIPICFPDGNVRQKQSEAETNLFLLFENDSAKKRKEQKEQEANLQELYAKIGKLTTQVEWLKKKSGL